MSDDIARMKKKYIAVMRAERRLHTRLDDIDWEFDVLLPAVAQLELDATNTLELPEFIVVDEDKN